MPLPFLIPPVQFPKPEESNDEGIVAYGGDLSVDTLLKAYSSGIFPWFSDLDPYPIWWSPPERMILHPSECKVSKSMRQEIRSGKFKFTFDTCFEEVIQRCASVYREDQGGTWITPEMIAAYTELHQRGYAHSAEVWRDGELVGGLYGVSLGGVFCGESMFSLVSNASKFAFTKLSEALDKEGFELIDCQNYTDHLASLGAYPVDREEFLERLTEAIRKPTLKGSWGGLITSTTGN